MFNMMTGETVEYATGSNLWFSDDSICLESSSGYVSLHADKDVRAVLADFLQRSYIAHLAGKNENTDTDLVYDGVEYRFAVSEDCPAEGPLYVYVISGSVYFIWLLDMNVMLPLAFYLLGDYES